MLRIEPPGAVAQRLLWKWLQPLNDRSQPLLFGALQQQRVLQRQVHSQAVLVPGSMFMGSKLLLNGAQPLAQQRDDLFAGQVIEKHQADIPGKGHMLGLRQILAQQVEEYDAASRSDVID